MFATAVAPLLLLLAGKSHALHVPAADDAASGTHLQSRAIIIQPNYVDTLGQSVTYNGCYQDSTASRLLPVIASSTGFLTTTPTTMTVASCGIACSNAGYPIFGLEFGSECYCGTTLGTTTNSASGCITPCTGNSTDPGGMCGGPNALQTYTTTITSPYQVLPITGDMYNSGWTYAGCAKDSLTTRLFPYQVTNLPSNLAMTPRICANACILKGYSYSGNQYGTECWCTNANPFATSANTLPAMSCNMVCPGLAGSFCGGALALTVYKRNTLSGGPQYMRTHYNLETPVATKVTFLNCYADSAPIPAASGAISITSGRPFLGYFLLGGSATSQQCFTYCIKLGYTLAGLVPGGCYCDNGPIKNSAVVSASACTTACSGDANAQCGSATGAGAINVYQLDTVNPSPFPGSSTTTLTSAFRYVACYVDSAGARLLPIRATQAPAAAMLPPTCADACAVQGYAYSGVEFGSECWCGSSLTSPTTPPLGELECNQTCTGNSVYACGQGNRISVYQATLSTAVTIQSATTNTGAIYTTPVCYPDSIGSRTLANRINSIPASAMTPTACAAACAAVGFRYAGVEYASECYCDNTISVSSIANSFCNMPCTGAASFYCGGGNAILIYKNDNFQISRVPSSTTTSPAYTYTYSACWADPAANGGARLLGNQLTTTAQTVPACMQAAAVAGYKWAGVEYGGECWASNTAPSGTALADSACSMPCNGDPLRYCGNGWTLSVYSRP